MKKRLGQSESRNNILPSFSLALATVVAVMATACRFGQPPPVENPDGTAPRTSDKDPLIEGAKQDHPLVEQRRGAERLRQRAEWSKKALLAEDAVARVGAQNDASCGRKANDEIKCWGWNYQSALGVAYSPTGNAGTLAYSYVPRKLELITESLRAFSVGGYNVCVVTKVGALKCFGANFFGQLGDGTSNSTHIPNVPSGLGSGVLRAATRFNKTCAILENKNLKCWGFTFSNIPVDVPAAISGVLQISIGQDHQCLLNENFGVQCWGSNQHGQLGLGAEIGTVAIPASVFGLETGVVQVASGAGHSCALLGDGRVKCWGLNDQGQLGTGNTENQNIPTLVNGLSAEVTALSLGDDFSCALLKEGQVSCWGRNSNGQLGDGTLENRALPTPVAQLQEAIIALGAGSKHTCAMNKSEQVQCWGVESFGSVGGGQTNANYSVPVFVKNF
jgi:hypothetical protein